ncbi:phage baseplate assembly protein V [Kingella kingae]|uniref:Phage P2 baseplate assembly protein gpV n=2 Tax=Kingella kingae TaxID=504 RepID=A0AAX2J6N5_KINKI|nr:phage baseplate assembly protein V [Kingella kingae]MDK4535311.1 phage baseplate assembly protein V [Kingella kingae]MDK4541826.1 phage baseplate assembly protein V [Kingella kingae]MDK4554306.1 phage baseplate assembly protein V [Kingella kingae]UOP03953.1 phage baseplate assembly protein V [Kingella kingae]SQH25193.1 Phage P2 baseplate assembly protein gpV [Kingella kingae]
MQTHDFGATLQFGTVAEVDDKKHAVRVDLPALENLQTDWLPVITLGAGGNQFYCLPDVGALVVCVLDARGESGVCLGAIYNDADPVPATSRDIHVLQYTNGTRIQHNRKTGDILIKTSGTVTIDADCVIQKTLAVNGLLTYTAGMAGSGGGGAAATISGSLKATGDITAGNISLQNHTHMEQGDGAPTSAAQ